MGWGYSCFPGTSTSTRFEQEGSFVASSGIPHYVMYLASYFLFYPPRRKESQENERMKPGG